MECRLHIQNRNFFFSGNNLNHCYGPGTKAEKTEVERQFAKAKLRDGVTGTFKEPVYEFPN